jgi:hypothetical protein
LTWPDDDNQWFWGGHLAHVSHRLGQIYVVRVGQK